MIKNERQYRITKAQADKFRDALALFSSETKDTQAGVHPVMIEAQRGAMSSQLEELDEQLAEYDALRHGNRSVLQFNSLEELPRALIKARIASGMSQKELADRLGLKEQQIQRYEATDYAGASLDRIRDVVHALGITVREDIFLPGVSISIQALFGRLASAGLDQEFILKRLLPKPITSQIESPLPLKDRDESNLALQAAGRISRIYEWSPAAMFDPTNSLHLSVNAMGVGRFKTAARIDERRLCAYTVYAHFLALIVLEATDIRSKPVPVDADETRKAIARDHGAISFEAALKYVWSLGIPVFPLNDPGAFHGACWRVEGRNIIVLKQRTQSASRWLFDLIHELRHTGENPEQDHLTVLELAETSKERRESEDEKEASRFAGDVVLDGRAEELAELCVEVAGGSVERLKGAVSQVAKKENIRVDHLANYLAFRLSLQNINWWGAATNLQEHGTNPLLVARDVLFKHIDLGRLNEFQRNLILQALTDSPEVGSE
jgi:transcriptional regulator with XRE-family HTH domain